TMFARQLVFPLTLAAHPACCSRETSYAYLPALPSFPTRRSSDLRTGSFQRSTLFSSPILCVQSKQTMLIHMACHRTGSDSTGKRSEEHTSELQSRFDLVCRLLLENKNHPQRAHRLPPGHLDRGRR